METRDVLDAQVISKNSACSINKEGEKITATSEIEQNHGYPLKQFLATDSICCRRALALKYRLYSRVSIFVSFFFSPGESGVCSWELVGASAECSSSVCNSCRRPSLSSRELGGG